MSRAVRAVRRRSTDELTSLPGGPYDGEVIHRDELVVMPR
jgi:hypothetical protein